MSIKYRNHWAMDESFDGPLLNTCQKAVDIVDRDKEIADLKETMKDGTSNIHIYGARGTGKTILGRRLADSSPDSADACYLNCTTHETQYKALIALCSHFSGQEIKTGQHTSQLQNQLREITSGEETIIVLDEVDFLLENDGNELIYFLSRMHGQTRIITISSNYPTLSSILDGRTYSSYRPRSIRFPPYTTDQLAAILRAQMAEQRTQAHNITPFLEFIADATSNAKFALHWLDYAINLDVDDTPAKIAKRAREKATTQYWYHLLNDFTTHHVILLESISQLEAEYGTKIRSGDAFRRYREMCEIVEERPLSNRRVSDYLRDLELLDIVETERLLGGKLGRTTKLQLNRPDQLTQS